MSTTPRPFSRGRPLAASGAVRFTGLPLAASTSLNRMESKEVFFTG